MFQLFCRFIDRLLCDMVGCGYSEIISILYIFDSRDDLYCSCRWRGGKPPKFWWQMSVVLLGSVVGGNIGRFGLGRIF